MSDNTSPINDEMTSIENELMKMDNGQLTSDEAIRLAIKIIAIQKEQLKINNESYLLLQKFKELLTKDRINRLNSAIETREPSRVPCDHNMSEDNPDYR
ncbi:MAG: hypothetical protein GF353_26660 [Candidatus Lokiarchaeota archaeon]|nr:hypothetical protein [Candidatus Lokiarchaeota archaeon]